MDRESVPNQDFRNRARSRRELTGRHVPAFWPGVGIVLGLPLLTWLAGGAPLEWSVPALRGFNFQGGLNMSPEFAALLAGLVIYTSAFVAEVVRSGIQAVNQGQWEAAGSLGLRRAQVLRLVVLPQALRVIIPPLGNSVNGLLKTTSIASVISMEEVLRRGQILMQQKFQVLEVFMVVAVIYLVMTTCWDFVQRRIEAHYGRAYGAAADHQLARDDH